MTVLLSNPTKPPTTPLSFCLSRDHGTHIYTNSGKDVGRLQGQHICGRQEQCTRRCFNPFPTTTSTHLVGIIQSWVSMGPSLILDGLLVRVSGECPIAISIVRTPSSTSVTSSQTTSSSSPRFPSTSSIVLLPSTTRNYKVSRQNWCLSWRMASSRKNMRSITCGY